MPDFQVNRKEKLGIVVDIGFHIQTEHMFTHDSEWFTVVSLFVANLYPPTLPESHTDSLEVVMSVMLSVSVI